MITEINNNSIDLFTIIIPAKNEEYSIKATITNIYTKLTEHGINHEIVVIDDGSTDRTWSTLLFLKDLYHTLKPIQNTGKNGFGNAIICGFDFSKGDAIVIMMADSSDSIIDAINYYHHLNKGYDCVFGSRFITGSSVSDYPFIKYIINRIFNFSISIAFNIKLNDTTNAFKAYRRCVIEGCRPYLSPHFNLTVELPLKSIVRGYSWCVVPISWKNRKHGISKLNLKEMGSRYLFICAYVWLEKYFSKGDYRKQ